LTAGQHLTCDDRGLGAVPVFRGRNEIWPVGAQAANVFSVPVARLISTAWRLAIQRSMAKWRVFILVCING